MDGHEHDELEHADATDAPGADLRTPALGVVAWLAVLAGLHLPPWLDGALVVTLGALVLSRWRRRGRAPAELVAWLLVAVVVAAGALLRIEVVRAGPLPRLAAEEVTARVRLELSRRVSPTSPPRQDQRATGEGQGAVQPRREMQPSQRRQPGDHTQRRCPQVGSWRVRVLELVMLVSVHLLTTSRAVRCRRGSCPRCRPPRAARRLR